MYRLLLETAKADDRVLAEIQDAGEIRRKNYVLG